MEISYHTLTKSLGTSYTDYRDRPVHLTANELAYFRATVDTVLKATGLTIPVYTCDHEQLPGDRCDALGIHWRSTDGSDEFITLDNYYIHEAYEVASPVLLYPKSANYAKRDGPLDGGIDHCHGTRFPSPPKRKSHGWHNTTRGAKSEFRE